MATLEGLKYTDAGDFLYQVEYYDFYKADALTKFKVELLCLDGSYAFHLMTESTKVPEELRYFSCNNDSVLNEFGFTDSIDYTSKNAVLQRAIDLGAAIANKYCKRNLHR